jgi:hypothetical protein
MAFIVRLVWSREGDPKNPVRLPLLETQLRRYGSLPLHLFVFARLSALKPGCLAHFAQPEWTRQAAACLAGWPLHADSGRSP